MLRALLAAALAPLLLADTPPARPMLPAWWMPTAGSGWIPLAHHEDHPHLVIPVTIDGQPGWAVVDTGFEGMFLSKRYVDAHGMATRPFETAESFGGRTTSYFTSGVSMAIGAMHTQAPATFAVTDLSAIADVSEHPIDAVVGMGVLGYVGWEVDEDHQQMRFLPSGTPSAGTRTALHHRVDGTRMIVDIQLGHQQSVPAIIDTGAESEISLEPAAAEQARVKITTDVGEFGVGGDQVVEIGRAPPVVVGGQRVVGAQADVDPNFKKLWGSGVQALIGMDLLRRYNISVDFPAGGLALQPRTTAVPPQPTSTSGVQGPLVDGHIQITHIMLNSPAAAAGLKAGDAICAVNDWTAADAFARHWGRAAPGARYAVHLCDGRTVPLVTRAFY